MKVRILQEFRDKYNFTKVFHVNTEVEFDDERALKIISLGYGELVEPMKEVELVDKTEEAPIEQKVEEVTEAPIEQKDDETPEEEVVAEAETETPEEQEPQEDLFATEEKVEETPKRRGRKAKSV